MKGKMIGLMMLGWAVAAPAANCEKFQVACELPSDDILSRSVVWLPGGTAVVIADPEKRMDRTYLLTSKVLVDANGGVPGQSFVTQVGWYARGTCGEADESAADASDPLWDAQEIFVVAENADAAIALLRIDREAPVGTYYAGWDARTQTQGSLMNASLESIDHGDDGSTQRYMAAQISQLYNSQHIGVRDEDDPFSYQASVFVGSGSILTYGAGAFDAGRFLIGVNQTTGYEPDENGNCEGTSIFGALLYVMDELVAYFGTDGADGYSMIEPILPEAELNATPTEVPVGDDFVLSWTSMDAVTCTLGGTGLAESEVRLIDSLEIEDADEGEYSYLLICSSITGNSAKSEVTVSVGPAPGDDSDGGGDGGALPVGSVLVLLSAALLRRMRR